MQRTRTGTSFPTAAIAAAAIALALATLSGLAGCHSAPSKRDAEAKKAAEAQIDEPNSQVPRYRVRDWSAVNDHTLILTTDTGTRYRAETLGPCPGLGFASRLGFETHGGFQQIDRYSSVVLEDGTRCAFQSFGKLKSAESKALDEYEKAGEKTGKSAPAEQKPASSEEEKPK